MDRRFGMERHMLGAKLPRGYPRKVAQIDGALLARKPQAIRQRACLDVVHILKRGKPTHVIVHAAYFAMLKRRAGEPIFHTKNTRRKARELGG